jgi:hypothetical protein
VPKQTGGHPRGCSLPERLFVVLLAGTRRQGSDSKAISDGGARADQRQQGHQRGRSPSGQRRLGHQRGRSPSGQRQQGQASLAPLGPIGAGYLLPGSIGTVCADRPTQWASKKAVVQSRTEGITDYRNYRSRVAATLYRPLHQPGASQGTIAPRWASIGPAVTLWNSVGVPGRYSDRRSRERTGSPPSPLRTARGESMSVGLSPSLFPRGERVGRAIALPVPQRRACRSGFALPVPQRGACRTLPPSMPIQCRFTTKLQPHHFIFYHY